MNRREFTALIAAGVVFPVDAVKALNQSLKRRRGSTIWYCLGDDWNSIDPEQVAAVEQCLMGKREWTPELRSIRQVGYEITVPPDRWVIVLGNKDRPAYKEDCDQFQDELLRGLRAEDWRDLTVVTVFTAVPFFVVDSESQMDYSPTVVRYSKLIDKLLDEEKLKHPVVVERSWEVIKNFRENAKKIDSAIKGKQRRSEHAAVQST